MTTNDGSTTNNHATACILCSRNCGITITTQEDSFSKIKGDKQHPMTKGYICQKAARLQHYQNNADRLTAPLKRLADGSYEPIEWDQALTEIASKLTHIRDQHGSDAFALVGGGGQGNHIGGAYAQQLRFAMGKSHYVYSALAQEKTMDFWVNGRLFGDQRVHATEDVEHADYVLFIGCNPYQSHGIPNARDTLKALKKDPKRTMVVIDPRMSETAKMADIHLQVKPGTDAYLMSAMLAIIINENLHDQHFLAERCTGFEVVAKALRATPVEEYVKKADVPLATVKTIAREFASAKSACVRIDLGLQQSLHSTLTAYLEKLLYLVTGNFGKKGGNNLHTSFLPLLGNTDERNPKKRLKLTAHHNMQPIAGMYPPNILPDEIEHEGEDRLRAVWVESANPAMTYADSQAQVRALRKLELLVVVDVAFTETARLADYVLPAASQYEKWEATGFNAEFPDNFFHLRRPILKPAHNCLPEPEIISRLLSKMHVIPNRLPLLENLAKYEPKSTAFQFYLAVFMATLKRNKSWAPYAPTLLYRTLGPALNNNAEAAAILLPLSMKYASKHAKAVRRAGIKGNSLTLGVNLFRKIMASESGAIISRHEFKDMWRFIRNEDKRIHLEITEVLQELKDLGQASHQRQVSASQAYPLVLMAGERRSYNANQIYRDPAWRKVDKEGALRMHPLDAEQQGIKKNDKVFCQSERGKIEVIVDIDDSVRPGTAALPHGYGMQYNGTEPKGPKLNQLTSTSHCDPFTKTPYHKYVPIHVQRIETP